MGALDLDARAAIVAEARAWLGVRFRHQGRSAEGVDCAGLVICVGRKLGLLPADLDVNGYSRRPDGVSLLQACGEHLRRIPAGEARAGDVLVFRIERDPQHLAVLADYFAGGHAIIHAYAPNRSVVENRLDGWWLSHLVAAYRFPGVA